MRPRSAVAALPPFLLALVVAALVVVGCGKNEPSERCVDGCGCTSDGRDPCAVARSGQTDSSAAAPDPTLEVIDGGDTLTDPGDASKDAPHDAPDAG